MSELIFKKTNKFGIFDVALPAVVDNRSEAERLFDRVYATVSYERAKNASLDSRAKMTTEERMGLTYGEVVFKSMETIFQRLRVYAPHTFSSSNSAMFYDLGSGSGRPVIMAATLFDFNACVGIEIMPCLHELALEAKTCWDNEAPSSVMKAARRSPDVAFILGSILNTDACDWTNGDIVFTNSTAFTDSLFQEMATLAKRMKPGALIVTLTSHINDVECFEVLEELRLDMSWGMADVFIHRRL